MIKINRVENFMSIYQVSTYLADVWPLASMEFAVRHQMPLEWKRASALLTHKWTIARMHTQMGEQVMLEGEALFAFAALIWTFSRVQQQVSVETMLVGEVFATMWTDMGTFAWRSTKEINNKSKKTSKKLHSLTCMRSCMCRQVML